MTNTQSALIITILNFIAMALYIWTLMKTPLGFLTVAPLGRTLSPGAQYTALDNV
jgi:hypothetical protein